MQATSADEAKQKKLASLNNQLSSTQQFLEKHPLTADHMAIVQNALYYMHKQAQWSSANSAARFVLTLQTALIGSSTTTSATGFIGPYLESYQTAALKLMRTALPYDSIGSAESLLTTTQIMTIAAIYLMTQILGDWKGLFPYQEPAAVKKAGLLLRDLGMTFLLGSQAIQKSFETTAQTMGLDEKSQSIIGQIGLIYVLAILLLLDEEDNPYPEEFLINLEALITPQLNVIEEALQKGYRQGWLEDQELAYAKSQLKLAELAVSHQDRQALRQVMKDTLNGFHLPYELLKEDLIKVKAFCSEVRTNLTYIFNQSETTMTTMTQSA